MRVQVPRAHLPQTHLFILIFQLHNGAGVQVEIPKFTVPKAKAYSRTGAGERHRPHKFIKAVSVPVALALMLVAAGSVVLTFWKTFGKDAPVNYSTSEILAARSWCAPACPAAPVHLVGMSLVPSRC